MGKVGKISKAPPKLVKRDLLRLASSLETMKAFDKTKFAIKNEHNKAQMSQLDNEWVSYKGPYLTLRQALDLAKACQVQLNLEESSSDELNDTIPSKAV